jgi:CRP-like cAMP-binding protein
MKLSNSLSFLADLSDEQVATIAEIAASVSHKAGEAIFETGDPRDCCYLVLKGAVRINALIAGDVEETLVTVREGGVFGELALITGETRSAKAVAIEDCELAVIAAADFSKLVADKPEIGRHLLQQLCHTLSSRLKTTTRQYANAVAWGINISDVVGLNYDSLIAGHRELRIRLVNGDTVTGTLLRVEHGDQTELLLRNSDGSLTIILYGAIASISFENASDA